MSSRLFPLGLALAAIALPSHAFQADSESSALEIVPGLDQTLTLYRADELAGDPAVSAYSTELANALGAGWRVASWNQFAGTARSVQGHGILVAPGGLVAADPSTVEAIARTFIAQHALLFATDGHDLVTSRVAHGANRWGVMFTQEVDGVPVRNTQVVIAIHDNGRLYAFGSNLYAGIDVSLAPTLPQADARSIARSSVSYDPGLELEPGPDLLVVVPVHRGVGQVDYHLTHRTDVPTTQPLGMWRTWVDAHTGEILYRENQIEFAYEGTTGGDVEVFSPCDGDTPDTIQPRMTVDISGVGSIDSDDNGDFSIAGNTGPHSYTAAFDGPYFNVNCSGCGGDALLNGTIEPDTPEPIRFDAATYRADERDAFHFANRTRMFIESIDPLFDVGKYTVNVNLAGCCNANWGGTSINFFREGCGCENMARVSDVVAHEFGHGVQNWALGGGQGPQGLGEGNSDITATFITDNPIVGIGVTNCVSGARDCDNDLVYPFDLNGSIHHDGQIICGFNWDVRRNLSFVLGPDGAKAHTASLWHFARKLFMNGSNNQPDQAERYLWVDDDNGDLSDGTPNFDTICSAMTKHGFDCPNLATSIDPGGLAAAEAFPLSLGRATPNPFHPSTSIAYTLGEAAEVELSIYDTRGRMVRTLVRGPRGTGQHAARWDGRSDDGLEVASGVYFYRLVVGAWSETRSMVLLK